MRSLDIASTGMQAQQTSVEVISNNIANMTTTGEVVWYLSTGLSKRLFAALLAAFARQVGAGRARHVVLVLDTLKSEGSYSV